MIPAAFEFARAKTLAEALEAAGAKNTSLICGGQSLIPLLRFRLAQPKRVVDISRVPQLHGIAKVAGGVKVGAATTYREILESKLIARECPLLMAVVPHIGDVQVRNLGTIGGGLAHADPASDLAAAVLALGATISLRSARAKRVVSARDYFKGPFETARKRAELIVDVTFPSLAKGSTCAYASFEQAASGYPLIGAAAVVTCDKDSRVTAATLAFTGLADTPFLADVSALVGTKVNATAIAKAAASATAGVVANEDIHASARYRTHLATVAATRALTSAVAHTKA